MQFNHRKFFDGFKARFDDTLTQSQVDGIEFLLTSFEQSLIWNDRHQISYAFATVYHETAFSFQPVEEGFYLEAKHGKAFLKKFQAELRYFPYFGRGFVQLTWKTGYERANKELPKQDPGLVAEFESRTGQKFDLVNHPEQALDPHLAFAIMTLGMHQGWFAKGQTLDRYINADECDNKGARRIINGTDKAALIADHAAKFEHILTASLVSAAAPQVPDPSHADLSVPVLTPDQTGSTGTQAGPDDQTITEQPPNSTETTIKETVDTPGGSASIEQKQTSINTETITQNIPRITAAYRWLGGFSLLGMASTVGGWFAGMPDWLIFLLGFLTGVALTCLTSVIMRHIPQLFDLAKEVAHINADPSTNTIDLVKK